MSAERSRNNDRETIQSQQSYYNKDRYISIEKSIEIDKKSRNQTFRDKEKSLDKLNKREKNSKSAEKERPGSKSFVQNSQRAQKSKINETFS